MYLTIHIATKTRDDLCESLSQGGLFQFLYSNCEGLAKLELPKPVQLDSNAGSAGASSCYTMREDVLL